MALPWQDDGSSTSHVDRGFTGSVPRGIKEALGWSEMARSLCLYDAFTVGADIAWNGRGIQQEGRVLCLNKGLQWGAAGGAWQSLERQGLLLLLS